MKQKEILNPAEPILLADEDPSLLASLKLVLLGAGRNNVRVADHHQAIQATLHREKCSLLVTDIFFRDRRGAGVIEELRQGFRDLPILVVSASQDLETAVACMRAGVADFLAKPVAMEIFLNSVDRMLTTARKEARRAAAARPKFPTCEVSLAFLQAMSRALCCTRQPPGDGLVTGVLEKICRFTGHEKGFLVLFPKDQRGTPRGFAWPMPMTLPGPADLMVLFRGLLPAPTTRSDSIRARILSPLGGGRPLLERLRAHSGILLPLLQEHETAGLVGLLTTRRPKKISPMALQFIEITANLAFAALTRRDLENSLVDPSSVKKWV